jgi:hypothetical protein
VSAATDGRSKEHTKWLLMYKDKNVAKMKEEEIRKCERMRR